MNVSDFRVEHISITTIVNNFLSANEFYLDRVVDIILDEPDFWVGITRAHKVAQSLIDAPTFHRHRRFEDLGNLHYIGIQIKIMLKDDVMLLRKVHSKIHKK